MIKIIYLIVIYILLICAHNVIVYIGINKKYTDKIRKSFTAEYISRMEDEEYIKYIYSVGGDAELTEKEIIEIKEYIKEFCKFKREHIILEKTNIAFIKLNSVFMFILLLFGILVMLILLNIL